MFLFILFFSFLTKYLVNGNNDLPYQNVYGDEYGKKWIFFCDDSNNTYFVDFVNAIGLKQLVYPEYNIKFRLYNDKRNPNSYILLDKEAMPLIASHSYNVIRGAPVKIITHGWKSSADTSSVANIKDEYLKSKYNYNVITVDWSETAESMNYPIVAVQTKAIGENVGAFVSNFCDRNGISGNQIHLIGHSLGAHVMGNAALASKYRLARVTGLDPARPMFELPPIPNDLKLDQSDANFVDVIHTCSGVLGVEGPIGHVDFYPNSGFAPQPGCEGMQFFFEGCSHGRAHLYFAETINNPKGYLANSCTSWNDYNNGKCHQNHVFMGEELQNDARGSFYLVTNPATPFGRDIKR